MRPTGKLKIAMMAIVILLSCGTADAQRWRWHSRPYRVVTVVTRPDVTVHVGNRFTQKERFRMATELSKAAAKAELDAFAADKDRPIEAVIRGKKKVYILRK